MASNAGSHVTICEPQRDDDKPTVGDSGHAEPEAPRRPSWPFSFKGLRSISVVRRKTKKARRHKRFQIDIKEPFMKWLKENQRAILIKFIVAITVIPTAMAIIGAIIERIIYGTTNAPGYHIEFMVFAGFVSVPFIFLRWVWPKEHLIKLDFCIYLASLTGFLVTLLSSSIRGEIQYYTAEHVGTIFTGSTYSQIVTTENVYSWLQNVVGRAFTSQNVNANDTRNEKFRLLPGRIALFGPLRLKQSRAKTTRCAQLLYDLRLPGLDTQATHCYSPYDINDPNTDSYGSLNYTYSNPVYKNYAGVEISAHDLTTRGAFATYPLSGFWVVWPPDRENKTVLGMLTAMKENNWIDESTREISLDFSVMLLDGHRPIIASVIYVIERAPSGRFLGRTPQISFSYFSEKVDVDGIDNDCGGKVDKEEDFLESAYIAVLPFIIYSVFLNILELCRDWRRQIASLYTYVELACVVTASMAIAARWAAIYYAHCNHVDIEQTIWPTSSTYTVSFYEFKRISDFWLLSRQAMSLAFFFMLVNFLRFITHFHTLDTLTKTIEIAFRELAAFSFSFLVIFVSFMLLFYFMFSAESKKYNSIGRSATTLWKAVLGDIEITDSMHLNRSLAIPFLILFTITFIFVVLTVIIAIISDAHEKVRAKRAEIKQELVDKFTCGDISKLSFLDQLKLRRKLHVAMHANSDVQSADDNSKMQKTDVTIT